MTVYAWYSLEVDALNVIFKMICYGALSICNGATSLADMIHLSSAIALFCLFPVGVLEMLLGACLWMALYIYVGILWEVNRVIVGVGLVIIVTTLTFTPKACLVLLCVIFWRSSIRKIGGIL